MALVSADVAIHPKSVQGQRTLVLVIIYRHSKTKPPKRNWTICGSLLLATSQMHYWMGVSAGMRFATPTTPALQAAKMAICKRWRPRCGPLGTTGFLLKSSSPRRANLWDQDNHYLGSPSRNRRRAPFLVPQGTAPDFAPTACIRGLLASTGRSEALLEVIEAKGRRFIIRSLLRISKAMRADGVSASIQQLFSKTAVRAHSDWRRKRRGIAQTIGRRGIGVRATGS
jgi:hypothetical protein